MIEIDKLLKQIYKTKQNKNLLVIAIDGMSCSGKSTLANTLSQKLNSPIIHLDDFFLPLDKRTKKRLNEPGGNFDRERFLKEVIPNLGKNFSYGKFNCKKMQIDEKTSIPANNIIIIEGSYSLHPDLVNFYDLTICLRTTKEIQLTRLISRESTQMVEKFKSTWLPMEDKYQRYYKIFDNCDILLDN